MPAEKKDGHIVADNASAGCPGTVFPQQRLPDHYHLPDQLSVPSQEQNRVGQLRACSLARTSEFVIRPACCLSSPIQKLVLRNRAAPSFQAAAALLSRLGGCKAAGPGEIEPGLQSPEEYC